MPAIAPPLPDLDDGREPKRTSQYGPRNPSRPEHRGVDFDYEWRDSDPDWGGEKRADGSRAWGTPPGTPVRAVWYGLVTTAKPGLVVVKMGSPYRGYKALYVHIENPQVAAGDYVTTGQHIADAGTYGKGGVGTTNRHLHFGVRDKDGIVDPNILLDGQTFPTVLPTTTITTTPPTPATPSPTPAAGGGAAWGWLLLFFLLEED